MIVIDMFNTAYDTIKFVSIGTLRAMCHQTNKTLYSALNKIVEKR